MRAWQPVRGFDGGKSLRGWHNEPGYGVFWYGAMANFRSTVLLRSWIDHGQWPLSTPRWQMLWLRPRRWWSCTRPSHGCVVDPESGECRCWLGHGAHNQPLRDDADRGHRGGDDHGERIRVCSESTRNGTSAVTSSAIATQGIHLLALTSLSTYRIIPQWIPMSLTRENTAPSTAIWDRSTKAL